MYLHMNIYMYICIFICTCIWNNSNSCQADAKALLEMPKWKGKEMKMLKNLKKKYSGPEHEKVVKELED